MTMEPASQQTRLLQSFKRHDPLGRGLIQQQALSKVLSSLDPSWTCSDFRDVLEGAGLAQNDSEVRYEDFIKWLFQQTFSEAEHQPLPGGLCQYLLSEGYKTGETFQTQGSYTTEHTASGEIVYVHSETGIMIWREALELVACLEGDTPHVLFFYTGKLTFGQVTGEPLLPRNLWEILQSAETGDVCASRLEPAQLREKDLAGLAKFCIPLAVPASAIVQQVRGPETWSIRCDDPSNVRKVATMCIERRKRATVETREASLGAANPSTLASMNELAFFLEAVGRPGDASAVLRRALEQLEGTLGKEHATTLTIVHNLAYLAECEGDMKQAEALARRALEGREKTLGAEDKDTMTSMYNLAELLEAQGRLKESEALFRKELEWCQKSFGARHEHTRESARNMERFTKEHPRIVAAARKPVLTPLQKAERNAARRARFVTSQ